MEQWFRPMGLNLRVSTDTSKLAAAVCDAYGLFGAGDKTAASDLQFEFIESGDDLAIQPNYRVSEKTTELLLGNRMVLSIHPADGLARGCFPKNLIEERSFFRLDALHFAVAAALPARGFMGVHAACIAIDGRAVLLRGSRGSGKTVLTYAAAARGFQVIADSTVWIAPNDAEWWGISRWIYLRPAASALFPEIAAGPTVSSGGETKIEIDLTRISDSASRSSIRAGVIVFLERNRTENMSFEPVSERQALALWSRGEEGNEADAVSYRARVGRLLRKPTYVLNAADDLARALDLVASGAQDMGQQSV